MRRLTRFFISGFMLTGVSLIFQLADSVFTIYLSSKIGESGMGLFSLVSSIYRFGVTLSLSGLSLAATKRIAERKAEKNYFGLKTLGYRVLFLSLLFGSVVSILLFLLSPLLSGVFLKSNDTILPLRVLSLSLPFLSVSSALSGYFTALRRPEKATVASVISFAIRIISTCIFLSVLKSGIRNSTLALSLGITISEIVSAVIILVFFAFEQKKYNSSPIPLKSPTKELLSVSTPIALSSYVRSALYTLEQMFIPPSLIKYGLSREDALKNLGLIKGMVLPVLITPSCLMYSFSSLLVPELAEAKKLKNRERIEKITSYVLMLSFIYSSAVCGIIFFFADDLSQLFFNSSTPAFYLRALAPLTIVMYLDGATDNLLKGLGEQRYCMKVNILDSFLSLLFVLILVPKIGIHGYAITILLSEIVNTFFSLLKLLKITSLKINFISTFLPVFFILSSCCFSKLLIFVFPEFNFLVAAIVAVIIYIFLSSVFFGFKRKTPIG